MTSKLTITPDQAEELLDASYGNPGAKAGDFTFVTTIEGDQRRWMQAITIVFSDLTGNIWGIDYDRGLTENQDHSYPWKDFGPQPVDAYPLYPHVITTTVYRSVPQKQPATNGDC